MCTENCRLQDAIVVVSGLVVVAVAVTLTLKEICKIMKVLGFLSESLSLTVA